MKMSKNNSKSNRLPSIVCQYKRRDNDLIPKSINCNKKLFSLEEKKLKRFFKCTKFSKHCFATKNSKAFFVSHLYKYHSRDKFFCVYCFPIITDKISDEKAKDMYSAEGLVEHMMSEHNHRRYQCNLCLYRAISADHINIHQSIIHPNPHWNSIQSISNSNERVCKIIECHPIERAQHLNVLPNSHHFYHKYSVKRKNNDGEHDHSFQCLYCYFMNQSKKDVIDHCVLRHPDYPIMYYNTEPEITSTQSPNRNNVSPQYTSNTDPFLETQENRVSSTDPDLESEYREDIGHKRPHNRQEEEFGFYKKPRISKIQKRSQTNITSAQRHSNSPTFKARPQSSLQKIANKIKQSYTAPQSVSLIDKWRPNILSKNSSKDGNSSRDRLANRPSNSSNISKVFICRLCLKRRKSNYELNETEISSHITRYHNLCKMKTHEAFCCLYCNSFFGSSAEVKVHANNCDHKSSDTSLPKAYRLIINKNQFQESEAKRNKVSKRDDKRNSIVTNDKVVTNYNKVIKTGTIFDKKYESDYIENSSDEELFDNLKKEVKIKERKSTSSDLSKSRTKAKIRLLSEDKEPIPGYSHHSKDKRSESHIRKDVSDEEVMTKEKKKSPLKTTFEIVVPESDEEVGDQFICLFCPTTSDNKDSSFDHLKTHFPEIRKALDSYQKTKPIHKWIKNFNEKQMVLFEASNPGSDILSEYKCPICVKIAKTKKIDAKSYRTFWDLRSHFWNHSYWTPVKCKLCKPDHELPNCDTAIVLHINSKHNDKVVESEQPIIKTMIGNKMKTCCTREQRDALEDEFIVYNRNNTIDSYIENELQHIHRDQETLLRFLNNCPEDGPNLQIKPLPRLNFDDESVTRKFLRKVKREGNKTVSDSNKVRERIDLVSDSDSDHEIVIHRKRHKHILILDDDEQSHNEDNDINEVQESEESENEDYIGCVLNTNNVKTEHSKHDKKQSQDLQSNASMASTSAITNDSNKLMENNPSVEQNSEQSISGDLSVNATLEANSSDVKRFICSHCNETYDSKPRIKRHISEAHTGLAILFTRATSY